MSGLIVIFCIMSVVFLGIGLWMGKQNKNYIFFGVRIPKEKINDQKLKSEKVRFKKILLITLIIFNLISFFIFYNLDETLQPVFFLIQILMQSFLINVCFYSINKNVKNIKKEEKWHELLTNKNIVMTDIKMRNDIDRAFNKKLYIIPWIIFLITIYFVYKNYASAEWLLVFAELFVVIITCLTGLWMNRSKIVLNGGDVSFLKEKIKEEKILQNKLNLILSISITLLFFLANLSVMNVINDTIIFVLVGVLVVSTIIIILGVIYFNKLDQSKNKDHIKNGEDNVYINRDDDDNYIFGMCYYNPKDPSVFVDKRIGYGTTINLGTKFGKISSAFMIVFLVSIIVLLLNIPKFVKVDLNLVNNKMTINNIYKEDLEYKNIENVEYMKILPGMKMRINGIALQNKALGYFKLKDITKAKLYIEDIRKPCLKIQTKDKRFIFINYENESDTEKLYKGIKEKIYLD